MVSLLLLRDLTCCRPNANNLSRDQELRFTVHDSPDYYQLKISVFTDDKKTDLIGETWVDLKNIIIPGGGQSDAWQNLSCRGKYAGEIRVEITFYDSRPKPDKSPAKLRQSSSLDQEATTPPKPRGPMKRRPLPSDPVTGEAPPANNPPPTPEYHHTPPRHVKNPSHSAQVPTQSPLQSLEYSQPSPAQRPPPSDQYAHVSPHTSQDDLRQDPYGAQPRQYDEPGYSRAPHNHRELDFHSPQPAFSETYTVGMGQDPRQSLPPEDERPPPPPVHRSRHNSAGPTAPDLSPTKMPMRHDVLRNEAHRNSLPSYPGQPTYRPFDAAAVNSHQSYQPPQDSSMPRHHSYDGTHDAHYRTPTVEDAPDSPTGSMAFRQSASRRPIPDELTYGGSPAPPVARSPGASPAHGSPLHQPDYDYNSPHPAAVSPGGSRDFSTSPGQMTYSPRGQPSSQRYDSEPPRHQAANYGLPALPASLVPGVDPALAQEVSERIYEERRDPRYSAPNMQASVRGRQHSEPPMPYGGQHSQGHHPQSYAQESYDRRSTMNYSGVAEYETPQHRRSRHSVSPAPADPSHTIRRKSVSPIPPSVEERRSFEVPFGPDSYDALNPNLASSREGTPYGDGLDMGKIITHDGKEIDPSDHLPVESWAPEPEPKSQSRSPDSRSRPMPGGAQPMPTSNRKQLRAARPQAAPAPSPSASYQFSSEQPHTPPAQSTGGRNRLHKRPNRSSVVPSPSASSPLAPISPDNYQDRQGQSPYHTPTRGLPRAHTWDYPNENHVPHSYDGRSQGYGPPIPAKVPVMSGANGMTLDDRSLAEELQSIDIGAGRSRRRGGY